MKQTGNLSLKSNDFIRIGIISDTHGLLRDEAVDTLRGVDLIIHAGDIDTPEVLSDLQRLAPVKAVRGNMDRGKWADQLPPVEIITIGGISIYVLHDLLQLDLDPKAAQINVVVNGHTHRPLVEKKDSVLYINPGSAGYRRNSAPLGVGVLTLNKGQLDVTLTELRG